MKTIIAFFVTIYSWFISLFKKKEKKKSFLEQYDKSLNKMSFTNAPEVPPHNNRRYRKGRRVQYINVGEGRQRAIYHAAK